MGAIYETLDNTIIVSSNEAAGLLTLPTPEVAATAQSDPDWPGKFGTCRDWQAFARKLGGTFCRQEEEPE